MTKAMYATASFEIDKHQKKTGDYSIANIQRNGGRNWEKEKEEAREKEKRGVGALIFAKVYRHAWSKNFIHNEITPAH